MRLIAIAGTISGMLLRAYLASVIGYAGFFAYQVMHGSLWRWIALILVPLWGLAMGVLSLPVALASSGVARFTRSVTGTARWPAMLLGAAVVGLAGTFLFIWYMTALIELIDWRARWPWPLAAALLAYLLEWSWRRRAPPTF